MSPRAQKTPLLLIWTPQPKVPGKAGERKERNVKKSVLTNRGDPGVTQSNPRKVALDGPFLNGLKEEALGNILAEGIRGPPSLSQQEGGRSLHHFHEHHKLLPTLPKTVPVSEDLRHPRENKGNSLF